MTFPQRLRAAIGTRPLQPIANAAGVSRRTVERVLAGYHKRGLSLDHVQALAQACGVSSAWLAFGEESERGGA